MSYQINSRTKFQRANSLKRRFSGTWIKPTNSRSTYQFVRRPHCFRGMLDAQSLNDFRHAARQNAL